MTGGERAIMIRRLTDECQMMVRVRL